MDGSAPAARHGSDPQPTSAPPSAHERDLAAARELAASDLARDVLSFEAPYVIEKLLGARLAETEAQAARLFDEVKKYLLLGQRASRPLPMSSALVDAAWHQFVLFTREYDHFCRGRFGSFFHHAPSLAGGEDGEPGMSQDEFLELYAAAFGELPDVWYDSRRLRADTLLRRFRRGDAFSTERDAERALLYRRRQTRELVCRASLRALAALEFIAQNDAFLLRELPELRSLEERFALCRPLVRHEVLLVCV